MNSIAPYIAGGLIALFSEGILGLASGQPSILRTDPISSTFASLQQTVPVATDALPGQNFVQRVNRSLKGDRLVPARAAESPAESIVASSTRPQGIKRPTAPVQAPRLPEGCNAAVSVLSDRIAANQASNCITALEVPWKVASAN